jgi:hypothetical protein
MAAVEASVSEYLACSHPHLPIEYGEVPEDMRDLMYIHGNNFHWDKELLRAREVTLGAILSRFINTCGVLERFEAWACRRLAPRAERGEAAKAFADALLEAKENRVDAYRQKWVTTMRYLQRLLEKGGAPPQPLWVLFLCRELNIVYWLRWDKEFGRVELEWMSAAEEAGSAPSGAEDAVKTDEGRG